MHGTKTATHYFMLRAASDRNQPLTFLEGRHRFACAIVVPEGFDGKLQWQVRFAGRIATTTDMLP
jgi:hypothetical protein